MATQTKYDTKSDAQYLFLANVNSLYVVVRLSSLTFVRPTQGIEIFGNVSTPFGTFGHPLTSR